jgi:hypothetical protein
VHGGRQSTATSHERFRFNIETDTERSWFKVNLFRPAAAQPVIKSVCDSIDFSLRAARGSLCDEAVPAGIAGPVHIEKSNSITFTKWVAVDVEQLAADLAKTTD